MSSLRTPRGMISFPALFVPKAPAPGSEPRYSVNLIFKPADQATPAFAALQKLVAETLDEKWPGKSKDAEYLRRNKIKTPFRPCSDREGYTGYDVPGGVFIAPWTKNQPQIVDVSGQNYITDPSKIWSGQVAIATVHAFAYDQNGNRGVSFNLNNLQIVRADMPRLDGRKSARDEFEDLSAEADAGEFEGRMGAPPAGNTGSPF